MDRNFEKIGEQDKIELVKQTQAETQRIFVGSLRPKSGHTLFEFDLTNKKVKKAEFKVENEISFEDAAKGLISRKREVDGKEGCIYISALNLKNAWKKFLKNLPANGV